FKQLGQNKLDQPGPAPSKSWGLSQTISTKCFDKCITKPGSSMSGSESSCISRCVDRYIEATGIITSTLFSSPH
ncbi:mitochondrial import inner membrane translocase subunit tim13, partial [Quercus suber]